MKIIDNISKTLKNNLSIEIKQDNKLFIAAAWFSIYNFQEMKKQLSKIDELRFIFTSTIFAIEKAKKKRHEFYVSTFNRERSLY